MAEKGEVFDVIGFEQPKISTRARFGRLLEYENVGGAIEGDDLAFEFVAQRCPDRKQAPHRQLIRVVVTAAVVPTLHFCVFLFFFLQPFFPPTPSLPTKELYHLIPQPLDPFIDKKIYNKKTHKGFIMNSLIFFTYYQPF